MSVFAIAERLSDPSPGNKSGIDMRQLPTNTDITKALEKNNNSKKPTASIYEDGSIYHARKVQARDSETTLQFSMDK